MTKYRSIRRSFNFSHGTLIRVAQQLLGALNHGTTASPVVDYLTAAFVADLENQIAHVTQLGLDQNGAFGAVNELTTAQRNAETDFVRIAAAARRAAKFAFTGNDALLRAEFQVGRPRSRAVPDKLDRGRKLLAACRTFATELAARGFSSANADQLEQALGTLEATDRSHESAKDQKKGLTAQSAAAGNWLYQQCVTVQHAARVVYTGSNAPGNPAAVEARARFLLDEFPPRDRAVASVGTAEVPVPVVPETEIMADPLESHAVAFPMAA